MMGQLSKPVRQFAALGLLGALVLAAAVYGVRPVVTAFQSIREQIAEERAVLGRLQSIIAQANRSQDVRKVSSVAAESDVFLSGESEAIKAANFQALVTQIATANGVRLKSTRALAVRDKDEIRMLGVQAQFTSNIAPLQMILHRLELMRPTMFITALQISPVSVLSQRSGEEGGTLDVRLEIYAAVSRKAG